MKRTYVNLLGPIAVVLGLFAIGATANAAPVYSGTYSDMYLKKNTFPDTDEEKIYFDKAKSSSITGHVGSQSGTQLVKFESSQTLDAKNGFAEIKPLKDELIHEITITAPGLWFEDLIFSIHPEDEDDGTIDLTVTTTVNEGLPGDSFSGWLSQDDWSNGENRILILATDPEKYLMQSITIFSKSGFKELKQVEISGVTDKVPPAQVVPIPAAFWLFGSALLGMVGISRRGAFAATKA